MNLIKIEKKLDEIVKEIQICKAGALKNFMRIGQLLAEVKDCNYWEGTGCKKFEEWADREVGFKRSLSYALIGVWETWSHHVVEHPELGGVCQTRFVRLLPLTKNDDEALENAHNALVLSGSDFEDYIREKRGGKARDTCEHKSGFEEWLRCIDCGTFIKRIN
jgi:hypothetical protein